MAIKINPTPVSAGGTMFINIPIANIAIAIITSKINNIFYIEQDQIKW
jgi:hypothetical protein